MFTTARIQSSTLEKWLYIISLQLYLDLFGIGKMGENYGENAFRMMLMLLDTFIIMYDEACK